MSCRAVHRDLWSLPNGIVKIELPITALGPFRLNKWYLISTRQVLLSSFWIFCNIIGYFVLWRYKIIYRTEIWCNLDAKNHIGLRFFLWNVLNGHKLFNRVMAMNRSTFTCFVISVITSLKLVCNYWDQKNNVKMLSKTERKQK